MTRCIVKKRTDLLLLILPFICPFLSFYPRPVDGLVPVTHWSLCLVSSGTAVDRRNEWRNEFMALLKQQISSHNYEGPVTNVHYENTPIQIY